MDELQKMKEKNIKLQKELDELKQTSNNLEIVSKSKNSKSKNKTPNNSHNTFNVANTSNVANTCNVANTSNFGTINNNFIINKPNIKTSNFGEEDLSIIPEIDKLIALKGRKEAFMNYFMLVNFNEKYPQNQNLLYKNTRSNIGSIVENNILVAKSIREILKLIINTRLPEIEDLMEQFAEKKLLSQIEIHTLKEIINFLKDAYLETEDVDGNIVKADKEMACKLRDFYDKLKLMIYNNNEMVNKNITKFLIDPLFDPLLEPINQLIQNS